MEETSTLLGKADFRALLSIIWRRKWIFIITAVVITSLAVGYTLLFDNADRHNCEAIKIHLQDWIPSYTTFNTNLSGTIDNLNDSALAADAVNNLVYRWDESGNEFRPGGS